MFGMFKKMVIINGAVGALKQAGFERKERDILTAIMTDTDLHGGINTIKIPQRLKSVIVSHLSLVIAIDKELVESYLYRDQYSMLSGAIAAQIAMCSDDEKQRATGFLSFMLSKIFNENVSQDEIKELYGC
ncbi:MAG: hypothetical protein HRT97_10870 [Moritella sp.]|uniref:hypothetical protein n=1 Tax=Moritella sp. TaxID=78556 RepID=UPI0025DD060A|nr:hypothetical protein [Moritella sp.]NQZ92827.1 hypothetical protein [Moritella sp.]